MTVSSTARRRAVLGGRVQLLAALPARPPAAAAAVRPAGRQRVGVPARVVLRPEQPSARLPFCCTPLYLQQV